MSLLGIGLGIVLLGGLLVLIFGRRSSRVDGVFATLVPIGCVVAAIPAIGVLAGRAPEMVHVGASGAGAVWEFGLDPLSAWFLLCILAVGAAAAVYGVSYLAPQRQVRPTHLAHAGLALLLVALSAVVTAHAVVPFLVAWEVMAVTAYLLVIFESDKADVRRAGMIYIVLTHASILALLGMFAAWGHGAVGLTFRELAARPDPLVLGLALVGFGIKAGTVPVHFWLPGAHAAAPSHVSAVLSGVMLKTGIYGLLRVTSLVGTPPAWWGWTLLLLGLVSGGLGVLWALAQHDLKRLLAYHSVENIGIILLGLGVGALGLSYEQPAVAVLGITGAVLHSLNHALFKSLLFLGAGAVARAAGTRAIDQLGGLARRMPWTAGTFLLGSVAIVGLPPVNGFVSEWVVFHALLSSGGAPGMLRFAVVAAAGLGLIGGLALACFVKLNGVVFLGLPRRAQAAAAEERGSMMLGPMASLAFACLSIGIRPTMVVMPAMRLAAEFIPGGTAADGVAAAVLDGGLRVGLLAVALAVLSGLLWFTQRSRAALRPMGSAATWACGLRGPTSRMQYTASSFAAPVLATLRPLAGVHERRDAASFHTHPFDLLLDGVVLPGWRQVGRIAREARVIQGGRLRWYLLYVILTVLGLLIYLTFARAS